MPLNYETDTKLQELSAVADEHMEWFYRFIRRLYYPDIYRSESFNNPQYFSSWLVDAGDYGFINESTLEGQKQLYDDLLEAAQALCEASKEKGVLPDVKAFDHFLALQEGFVHGLRRLEKDCALSDSGVDVESGLRSKRVMYDDLSRELERRARRGNPFTLVIARIDHYKALVREVSEEERQAFIEVCGRLIKKCIRSFDDAYRCQDDQFVMSLKHSKTAGGTAAVNRLRRFLQEENHVITTKDGKSVPLTMSFVVAEPVPGDTIDGLLENMNQDLDRWDEGGDTALEYIELSPLQRYLEKSNE